MGSGLLGEGAFSAVVSPRLSTSERRPAKTTPASTVMPTTALMVASFSPSQLAMRERRSMTRAPAPGRL